MTSGARCTARTPWWMATSRCSATWTPWPVYPWFSSTPTTGKVASGSIGLGFAIPSNQARRTAEQLIETGKATVTVGGKEGETDSGRVVGMFTERAVLHRERGGRSGS